MEYYKKITLKNGKECVLRNGAEEDAEKVLENFILTHGETDFLLTYPDECTLTVEKEIEFLVSKLKSENEIEMVASVDGTIVGTASIDSLGKNFKISHRAGFGISVAKAFWGLGIGRELTEACIECAKAAGFKQLELDVVSQNETAISLYKKLGFTEYGRNPKGMRSRISGYQELVYMFLEL